MNRSDKGKDADYGSLLASQPACRQWFRSFDMRTCGENDLGLRFVDTRSTDRELVIYASPQIIRDTEDFLA